MFISRDLEFLFDFGRSDYKHAKTRNDSYQPETQNGHCVGEHVCFQNLTQLLDTKKLGSVSEQVANRCDFCVNWNKICGDRGLIHEKIDTVQDRNTKLFGNQFMSDIQFVLYEKVDDKWPIDANSNEIAQYVVPGHKHILSTASSVFYLMFNGSLPEKQAEIKVTDISAAGFLHMLKYLYCNDTEIHPHCLWDTVNAANKYQLPHLLKECERQLIDSLAVRNFCDYIEFNRLFELKRLQVRCLEFWDVQARSVVHTPAFESLSCDVLIQLISRDTLDLEEIQVFNACMRWTQKQSMGHSKPIERSRNLLKTLLGEVRILDISEKEFVEGAVKSYIFNDCDFKQFFVFYALGLQRYNLYFGRNSVIHKFSKKSKRRGPVELVCSRFLSYEKHWNKWSYHGKSDSISFLTDRQVFLRGYGLFGSSMVSSKGFEVQMWLADGLDGPRIATVHKKIGPQKSVRLYFDTPIKLRANRVYSAYVNIVGSELSYFGVQGQSVVMVEIPNSKNSLTVRFLCNPHSKNGTGTVAGQIPELLFYSPLNLAELP